MTERIKLNELSKRIFVATIVVSLSFISCKGKHSTEEHGKSHWGYSDFAAWGEVSSTCVNGTKQSPINVGSYKPDGEDTTPVAISYDAPQNNGPTIENNGPTIENNGHTVQVNYPKGSTITIGETTYTVLQFHFHVGSEHQINAANAAMEMHIVHKSDDGKLAVISVLFNEGEDQVDDFFNEFLANVKGATESPTPISADLTKLGSIIPSKGNLKNYFKYSGSLTTPLCSEGVEWRVISTAHTTNTDIIKKLESVFSKPPGNARPVQSLNDRTVSSH